MWADEEIELLWNSVTHSYRSRVELYDSLQRDDTTRELSAQAAKLRAEIVTKHAPAGIIATTPKKKQTVVLLRRPQGQPY